MQPGTALRFVLLGLLFLLLRLDAVAQPSVRSDAEGSTIRIGSFLSLTGALATFGEEADRGVRLAVEEINSAGGLLGKQVELVSEDSKSFRQDALEAVEKLIEKERVVGLIGEVSSTASLSAAVIAERSKVPMVSLATNEQVTLNGRSGEALKYVFRSAFIDPFQGTAMAKFARENLKLTRVAIITDHMQDYSIQLSKTFRETFKAMGGEIVGEQSYDSDDNDFKTQLVDIKAKKPQAIYLSGYYTDVSRIAIQARALGITVPLLGGDGWDSPVLTEGQAGRALEGAYFTNQFSPFDTASDVRGFTGRYKKRYGSTPGTMAALGYDAVMLLADAIRRAGTTDAGTIAARLASSKDVAGSTGPISLDAHHNAIRPAVILKIRKGKFDYFSTINP